MKWTPAAHDPEIHAVETAIASDRQLLERAFVDYVDSVRESAVTTITSPKFLLGALGVGFLTGKFLFRPKAAARTPAKHSVLGLLGAGALSLIQAQFGGPFGLARWLTERFYEAKRSSAHAGAVRRSAADHVPADPQAAATQPPEQPAAVLLRR
ncbi:MAG: hypothetical protein DIU74_010205 [Pseudomonadota bacterium]